MLQLLLFAIYIFSISLEYEVDETLIESVPKYYYHFSFNSFKIFKYIPSCEDNIKTKNVYVQTDGILYLYSDFSNIKQDESSKFINYNKHLGEYSNLVTDLTCGKDYYFVLSINIEGYEIVINRNQITIINQDENIINLSPLLSNYFSLYPRTEKEEIFYYSFNETKYVLITFNPKSKIQIFENESIIYENETENFFKYYEFKENINYTITYKCLEIIDTFYSINFQIYSQPKFFEHDFKKEPAIIYSHEISSHYYEDSKYYFDIDISDYNIGENVVFFLAGYQHYIGYQFKNDFNGKNYIDFYTYHNFISIKKTKNDSSLIIYFQFRGIKYSIISLIKPIEIKSDYNSIIKGPQIFLIEYNSLNGMNSIGIKSNVSFIIFEQEQEDFEMDYNYNPSDDSYANLYITKQNNLEPHIFKKAFIYFNTTDNVLFIVKKFNFSIFLGYKNDKYKTPGSEYFQLCQGNNSPKELYFYTSKNYNLGEVKDFFSSVFGNFNTYFIKENEIQNITDLNFDNIEKNNFYNFDINSGYLKINCTNPVMLKHSNIFSEDSMIEKNFKGPLITGKRYYIKHYHIMKSTNFKFDDNLINKNIKLKITLYGLRSNDNVELIFNNGASYNLNNIPLKVDYKFEDNSQNGFYFKSEKDQNEYLLLAEVIVGFLSEEYNNDFEVKDFKNTFGTNSINKKGIIIKIPKDFDQSLYDFSIILPRYLLSIYDILISYEDFQFIAPLDKFEVTSSGRISPIIPLFKVNPYEHISEQDNNKYFYILIYLLKGSNKEYSIKQAKIYTDILKFNTINPLSKLDKKYYHQLKIPKTDYNSLLIESIFTLDHIKLTLSKDNIQFPITQWQNNYLYQFIINNDNKNYFLYK